MARARSWLSPGSTRRARWGVAHLLATDISALWGQAADDRWSVVVGTTYDPETHEPARTELLSPLYRHGHN
jgi:hypothetical protein